MSLVEGDYRNVEERIVATLVADTAAGGLFETGAEAVAGVVAGDEETAEGLGQDRFPAILVRAVAKKETPGAPVYSLLKTFQVSLWVLDRGMDRSAVEESVRKIAARVEDVLREQSATDRQFLGLPDLIAGSEGVLVSSVKETVFSATAAGTDRVVGRARVGLEVQVPCAFRYE